MSLRIALILGGIVLSAIFLLAFKDKAQGHSVIIQIDGRYKFEDLSDTITLATGQQLLKDRLLSKRHRLGVFSVLNGPLPTASLVVASNDWMAGIWENEPVSIRSAPNDPQFFKQPNLERIKAPELWDVNTNGVTINNDTIVIAILEPGGFSTLHADLKENIWVNRAEIPDDGLDNDDNGYVDDYNGWNFKYLDDDHGPESFIHGTPVASLIGAKGNNNIGITGVCWNVKLLLMSYTDDVADVIEAYEYIYHQRKLYNESGGERGAFVVATNASFGISRKFPSDFPFWCTLYDDLGKEGVLSIAATANAARNVDEMGDMPTLCPSDFLITVTNLDQNDRLHYIAGFSSHSVDLAAPGEGNYAARPGNTYGSFGGTSAAAPLVAGGIGLLYSLPCTEVFQMGSPGATALLIKSSLLDGVKKYSALSGLTFAEGALDLEQSAKEIEKICLTPGESEMEGIKIFPNPSSTFPKVIYTGKEMNSIKTVGYLFDQTGREVWSGIFRSQLLSEELEAVHIPSNISPGIYFLQSY